MPPHYGTGTGKDTYRRQFSDRKFRCRRCGYSEFKSGVDVHHIDADDTNNRKENLLLLCACCHRALHCGLWALEEILGT
jgi:hypothetical protein